MGSSWVLRTAHLTYAGPGPPALEASLLDGLLGGGSLAGAHTLVLGPRGVHVLHSDLGLNGLIYQCNPKRSISQQPQLWALGELSPV